MTQEHPIHYDRMCEIKEKEAEELIKNLDIVIGNLSYDGTITGSVNIQRLREVRKTLIKSHPDY